MRTANGILFALAAAVLLAGMAGAEVTALSEDAALDTRSFTVDWSESRRLNTKRILGTMMLLR